MHSCWEDLNGSIKWHALAAKKESDPNYKVMSGKLLSFTTFMAFSSKHIHSFFKQNKTKAEKCQKPDKESSRHASGIKASFPASLLNLSYTGYSEYSSTTISLFSLSHSLHTELHSSFNCWAIKILPDQSIFLSSLVNTYILWSLCHKLNLILNIFFYSNNIFCVHQS